MKTSRPTTSFTSQVVALAVLCILGAAGCGAAIDSSSTALGPTATISSTVTNSTSTSPIPMTVTFSVDVSGLTISDFVITNGNANTLVSTSNRVYTFNIVPLAWGTVSVTLPTGTVTDASASGAGNQASNTFTITYGSSNTNSFGLSVDPEGHYSYYLNKVGQPWGTACSISNTAPLGENSTCILDVNELDMWFWGIKLQIQSPPNMCKYVNFYNYYFYNFEVGYGPSTYTVYIDNRNASGAYFGAPFAGVPAGCSAGANNQNICCVVDGTTYQGCTGIPEIYNVNATTGAPTCMYDHRGKDASYPNCCSGTYNSTIISAAAGATATVTNAATAVPWGGRLGEPKCIAGPAADDPSWPKSSPSGLPTARISYAKDGYAETYVLGSPREKWNSPIYNLTVANYYAGAGYSHSHTDGVVSTYPFAIDPIRDRSLSSIPMTVPNYVIDCLDEAFDIKQRLTLRIRDWNTSADFTTYGTSSGVTLNPDQLGVEGTNCAETNYGANCNDIWDWDDLLVYTGTFPNYPNIGAGDRFYFYPRLNK